MGMLTQWKCRNCGAKLSPSKDWVVSCEYCQTAHENRAYRKTAAIDAATAQQKARAANFPSPQVSFSPWRAVLASSILGLIALGATFGIAAYTASKTRKAAVAKINVTGLPAASMAKGASYRFSRWPAVAAIGDAAHLVGPFSVDGGTAIMAVSVESGDIKWQHALGKVRNTKFFTSSAYVVVATSDAKLDVYAVADGKKLQHISLSDRVQRLCLHEHQAYVRTLDRSKRLVDLRTGSLSEGKRPDWCPKLDVYERTRYNTRSDSYRRRVRAPKVKGFKPEWANVEGSLAVLSGYRAKGTRVPEIVGVDIERKKVLWHEPLGTQDWSKMSTSSRSRHDALVDGILYSAYQTTDNEWHLTAIDGKTGKRYWTTHVPPLFAVNSVNRLYVGKSRVMLLRSSSMDLFSRDTGKIVGRLGKGSYRDRD